MREGLVFDYPASTSIIPDPKTIQLRDFLGARWVAQEYIMTPDQIKETYDVDVTTGGEDGMLNYHAYRNAPDSYNFADGEIGSDDNEADSLCTVWEIYSKTDGVVYHVCDGYPDYLREPAPPQIKVERFYPWFGLIFNECVHETDIFPPSDVDLIRDMQSEMNRAREGLREHRIANKPKHVVAGGKLSHDDKEKLQEHPPNAIIELDALQPQEKVTDLLQPYSGASIDPNLYETASIYEDVLRVTGTQEANLGGVSGATATETHIAETSRMSSVGSNIDELDDMLTQMARASGQILLLETDVETARKIAGPGALWPDMTREDVVEEIYLEIEAGSTGKPSKAMEVQNAERLVPLLQNIPGISPEWMAKELIRRMDDRVDMTSAFSQGVPSIVAMNAMNGIANTQGLEGQDQGVQGSNNAEQTGAPPGGMGAPNDPGAHTG